MLSYFYKPKLKKDHTDGKGKNNFQN